MNFTVPDGRIVLAFASFSEDMKTFPGNAYHSSNARITHAWMDKELAEIEADPDAVNFISKFRGTKYVVTCDAGLICQKKCIQSEYLSTFYEKHVFIIF